MTKSQGLVPKTILGGGRCGGWGDSEIILECERQGKSPGWGKCRGEPSLGEWLLLLLVRARGSIGALLACSSSAEGLGWRRHQGTLLAPFFSIESKTESPSVVSDSLRPMDYTVRGILKARILEKVAFPFSRGSSYSRDWTQVSCISKSTLAGGFFFLLSHLGNKSLHHWVILKYLT